ncbi:histidine kinase [Bosea minatitlanensis]|uniref:Histidine kinase n=1 Tax=Bosea minatitlanensis TaxID=128782 RepID=A0ABW0F2R3_9HYPH|nr:histidine kinase [Bosea minatitlanensis]MCT4493464.1 histidine kinase [Bosea minatitlanensis]
MPTLFRFLFFLAVLAGLVFAGMVALVTFVQPVQREMVEIVPPARLQPKTP